MITSKELRQKYLEFFELKGHKIVASASVMSSDPTTLFTSAGMQPLVPYLMGQSHPEGKRLVSVQKCIRTGDIDEVGDNSHMTFFEMLGNWSLGDYFKEESIQMSYEFLTSKDYLGLDKEKLAVTVFKGDDDAEKDNESVEFWKSAGIPDNRIGFLGKEDNWWPGGGKNPGPQGPDTEIFYWVGESEFPPSESNPETDEKNWMEIWNNVFMQFNKTKELKLEPLAQKNVDTGMGLERTVAVLNGFKDVYEVDTIKPIIEKIEEISNKKYISTENSTYFKSFRIISDHIRTATMIMGDNNGISPSNVDQGYIVRRLIRRAIRHGKNIGINEVFCFKVAEVVIKQMKDIYPEVKQNQDFIINQLTLEEEKFRKTLEKGLKEFDKILNGFKIQEEKTGNKVIEISTKLVFKLFDTYGFPFEMTEELAKENNLAVDKQKFDEAFKKHQDLSRAGAEKKFKGGMADTGDESKKLHTATHLLHAALRKVLGNHVEQKGSNITADRLRFDFSHGEKLTDEEKEKVEGLVNAVIDQAVPIIQEEMTVDEAKSAGAIGLFGDKYGEKVKVYTAGEFSKEICGGPHMENTSELGHFKIKKEQASSAGIRRIKAVLE